MLVLLARASGLRLTRLALLVEGCEGKGGRRAEVEVAEEREEVADDES